MARTKRSKKYNEDEISNLPNTILVHILSFLTTIEAMRTSLLSKRWENLWKSVPNLQLDSRSFHKLTTFNKFVRHVLSNRDDDCNVDEFRFRRRGNVDESLTNRVIKYAVAHHVKSLCIELDLAQFCPLPVLLSCQSIKTLELGNFCHVSLSESSLFNSLTELNLWDCSFGKGYYNKFDCFDPLASCINLKTLYMYRCQFWGTKILKISLPKLVNLTITCMRHCWELSEDTKVEIVAPKLSFFSFANTTPLNFSKLDVPSLESVNIDTGFVNHRHRNPSREEKEEANRELINMFKGLHNAQSVTLSFETIKVLTMVPGMLGYHPSPFRRLKFLKLYTQYGRNQSRMPAHVISYLLGDSPGSANLEIATPRSKAKEY